MIREIIKKPKSEKPLYKFMETNGHPIIHDGRVWKIMFITEDVLPLNDPPNKISIQCQMIHPKTVSPKIYISGQITGLDIQEASDIFQMAEFHLKNLGWSPINPMTIKHDHDQSWESYMREDIKELMDCDAIFMLPNWTISKGAKVEHDIAKSLNIPIFYQRSLRGYPKPEDLFNFE